MQRFAQARWMGDGKTGHGTLTSQSQVLNAQPYSFQTRFVSEDGLAGTNPEELLAAAHAGCFSMALSFMLAAKGLVAEQLDTRANVNMSNVSGHFVVESIVLTLKAKVPGVSVADFRALAEQAKANCPVSKALAATSMHLHSELI